MSLREQLIYQQMVDEDARQSARRRRESAEDGARKSGADWIACPAYWLKAGALEPSDNTWWKYLPAKPHGGWWKKNEDEDGPAIPLRSLPTSTEEGQQRQWWQCNPKTGEVKRLNNFKIPQDIITEPFETMFFFPTLEDQKLATKWLGQLDPRYRDPDNTSSKASALRLVSERVAVPAAFLDIVRKLEER